MSPVFGPQTVGDFGGGSRFEEKFERLLEVVPSFRDRITLARDIHFGAQGHVAVVFTLDDGGQVSGHPVSPLSVAVVVVMVRFCSSTISATSASSCFAS